MMNEQGLKASSKVSTPILMNEHLIHRRNLHKIKAVMKISAPSTFSHLLCNPKQEYIKQTRNNEVLLENTRLVQKMLHIQNKPGKHNPKRILFKSPSTGSLNFPLRMKQYHTMLEGNKVTALLRQYMEKIIRDVKPTYSTKKQLHDFKRIEQYSQNLKYPNSKEGLSHSQVLKECVLLDDPELADVLESYNEQVHCDATDTLSAEVEKLLESQSLKKAKKRRPVSARMPFTRPLFLDDQI